jgi:hypothetical protein
MMEVISNDTAATVTMATPDHQSIEGYVRYVEEYKVLLCIRCEHAIVPGSGIRRHLIDHHKEIPLVLRKKIIVYAASLQLDGPRSCMAKCTETTRMLNGFTLIDGWKCGEQMDNGTICRKSFWL